MANFDFRATVLTHGDDIFFDSDARVSQHLPDGRIVPVADIHDHYAILDFRNTKITWASGSMHFQDLYDTPLIKFPKPGFLNEKNENICTLRGFHRRTSGPYTSNFYHCLDYEYDLFQIECGKWGSKYSNRITVYESQPQQTPDGLFYPVLAKIMISPLVGHQWEYQVLLRRELPTPLLMAVLSLPFTCDRVCYDSLRHTPDEYATWEHTTL